MLRLPALVLGTLNTWLVWRLGLLIGNKNRMVRSPVVHRFSIRYRPLRNIHPPRHSPGAFYLASILYAQSVRLYKRLTEKPSSFIWADCLPVPMLSKYTGAFLWLGTLLYLLLYNRKMFKTLGCGPACSYPLLVTPVIWWNSTNPASGLSFHADRVAFFGKKPQLLSLGREVLGSFLYNNPVQIILLIGALRYYIHLKRRQRTKKLFRIVLFQSVPMVATFLFFSLFRDTLPHWSAPAFFPLWLFTAAVLAKRNTRKPFRWSLGFTAAVLILGTLQIRTGMIPLPKAEAETTSDDPYAELGRHDVTLDMYGWKQLGEAFGRLQQEQETLYALSNGEEGMPPGAAVLATRWFPAAHYDYYVAKPNGTVVKTTGPLDKTHKYQAITQDRGGIQPQEQLYYIASSRYSQTVQGILPLDTVFVYRNKKPVIRYIISKVTH